MTDTPAWSLLLITAVTVQRLVELRRARRNASALLARGAREAGRLHYPWLVLLHAAFLAGLLAETTLFGALPPPWWLLPFGLFLLAQCLRLLCLRTLGARWTTRILVLEGETPVRSGPYRFLRHPNYLAVLIEFVTLPLVVGAYRTLAVFAPLNALLLCGLRIPAEERAWADSAGSKAVPHGGEGVASAGETVPRGGGGRSGRSAGR